MISIFIKLLINIYLVIALFCLPLIAYPNNVPDLLSIELENYKKACLRTTSFKAKFTQTYYNAIAKDKKEEKGKILFHSPNMILMKYEKPNNNFFLFDGNFFYFYNSQENQVIKTDPSDDKAKWFDLLTNCNITSYFEITKYKLTPSLISLILKPLKSNEEIMSINAIINRTDYTISNITIIETIGNQNSFSFSNISLNCKVELNLFKFIKPKNAEIVYLQ